MLGLWGDVGTNSEVELVLALNRVPEQVKGSKSAELNR